MDVMRNVEHHSLSRSTHISATESWLDGRAARAVFSSGARDASGAGWVIENRDGSIVLARLGDVLEFDGARVTRR